MGWDAEGMGARVTAEERAAELVRFSAYETCAFVQIDALVTTYDDTALARGVAATVRTAIAAEIRDAETSALASCEAIALQKHLASPSPTAALEIADAIRALKDGAR